MFTARATWNADELAGRLEITTRTLRRDVTRLRDLGYPIASTTGRYGGYELGAGGRLPPLLLDDDEAIAVSVALRELSFDADPTLGEAALSASTKLRQVLPEALRDRVDALGEVVVGVRQGRARRAQDSDARIELPNLMALAMCCRRGERVRFTYRDGSDRVSERRVEPHRLVSLGRRWYLVGFDLDRDDWRTYRVDRISELGRNRTPQHTAGNARRRGAGQRGCRRPSVRDTNPRARACRVARRRHVHRTHGWRRRAVHTRFGHVHRHDRRRAGLGCPLPRRASGRLRGARSPGGARGAARLGEASARAEPAVTVFRPADVVTPREGDDIET